MAISNIQHLKIGLVTPFFLPTIGGARIYCFELAKALAAQGHEIHLFTVAPGFEDAAYTLHPILTGRLGEDLGVLRSYNMDIWHALYFFYAPLALIKKNVFVTGHGDDCFSFRVRFPLFGRKLLERYLIWRIFPAGQRVIRNIMGKLERWMNYLIYWLAIMRSRRIIMVSTFTRRRLHALYPFAYRKTTVIPPGVNERFFASRPSRSITGNSSHKVILTVTRLDEADRIKNVHGVIEALGMMKDRYDFIYRVISGDQTGNYRHELEEQIQRLGLTGRVFLEGRKTDQELLECYHQADLFILASYAEPQNFEGFGIVFLEANACGVPVISSREGGMADYIVNGENGIYVDNPSADGIRSALQLFFDGESRFDANRVRSFPEKFRWPHIAERVYEAYQEFGKHSRP